MKAVYMSPEGEIDIVEFSVEESGGKIRELIGGNFDLISLPKVELDIWVHDEGLLLDMERNFFAESLWNAENNSDGAYIVGPVVITGIADSEGNCTSVDDDFLEKVIRPCMHFSKMYDSVFNKDGD